MSLFIVEDDSNDLSSAPPTSPAKSNHPNNDKPTSEQSPIPDASRTHKRKRRGGKQLNKTLWEHARPPIYGVEPTYTDKHPKRRIWYCQRVGCKDYSVTSANGIRGHMASIHNVVLDAPTISAYKRLKQQDLHTVISKQRLLSDAKVDSKVKDELRAAADKPTIAQAVLRLIVRHDLPLTFPTWPATNTLLYATNHMSTGALWSSSTTTANHLRQTFELKRRLVAEALANTVSKIHLTTDTWHSPNHIEFQAITAHWLGHDGKLKKALLALSEMLEGHTGILVADEVLKVLKDYGIDPNLGYITTDNATCNDTLMRSLATKMKAEYDINYDPKEYRLRCAGHVLNLSMQAFLFAADSEAVEEAQRQADAHNLSIDDELVALSDSANGFAGRIACEPHQKIHAFGARLRRTDKLIAAFRSLAGKALHVPNDTRWHSWFDEFNDAYELRESYSALIRQFPEELGDFELSVKEWDLIKTSIDILTPFKVSSRKLESDQVLLDEYQPTMDYLAGHLEAMKLKHKGNKPLLNSLITAWYAFDKYYLKIDDSAAYVAAVLLQPNRRKNYLSTVWKASWIKPGIDRARALWYKYLDDHQMEASTRPSSSEDGAVQSYDDWQKDISRKQRAKGNGAYDEFERFITAPPDSIDFNPKTSKLSVLDWWFHSANDQFPVLRQMALDVLSAQAMSAESERVFSGTRRIITWSRSSLGPEMIEILECLKHWQTSGLVDDLFDLDPTELP